MGKQIAKGTTCWKLKQFAPYQPIWSMQNRIFMSCKSRLNLQSSPLKVWCFFPEAYVYSASIWRRKWIHNNRVIFGRELWDRGLVMYRGKGWRKKWVSFPRIYKNYQIDFVDFAHYSMALLFSRFLLRVLVRGRGLRGLKTPRGNSSRVKCWNGSPFNTITEGEIFLSLLHVHTACCLSWVAEVSVSEFAYSYGVKLIFMEKVNEHSSIQ